MNTWKCKKCGNTTAGTNMPLGGSCWKGGVHDWIKCAEPGTAPSTFRCSKCGNTLVSANEPMDRTCSRGGTCSWQRCQ